MRFYNDRDQLALETPWTEAYEYNRTIETCRETEAGIAETEKW
jgi:hypothetical protein